jgi:hypothetical protein
MRWIVLPLMLLMVAGSLPSCAFKVKKDRIEIKQSKPKPPGHAKDNPGKNKGKGKKEGHKKHGK